MKTSVIVPTYNGRLKVLNVLRALEKQRYLPDEVLVVVDGSTDGTVDFLLAQEFSLPNVRVLEQPNRGRAAVRNFGAREASGELLIFFDDDMRPLPECIAEHIAHAQLYPYTFATGMLMEELTPNLTDFQRYKAYLSRKWLNPYKNTDVSSVSINFSSPFLTAANLSVPRALYWELNGFDELLRDAEDFDLAVRALEAKHKLYLLPLAIAWHDDFITCTSYVQRLREYRKAHALLMKLYPERYFRFNQHQVAVPATGKGWLFSLMGQTWWVRLIDRGNLLKILPQRIRFRLYDLVTTALGVYHTERHLD